MISALKRFFLETVSKKGKSVQTLRASDFWPSKRVQKRCKQQISFNFEVLFKFFLPENFKSFVESRFRRTKREQQGLQRGLQQGVEDVIRRLITSWTNTITVC